MIYAKLLLLLLNLNEGKKLDTGLSTLTNVASAQIVQEKTLSLVESNATSYKVTSCKFRLIETLLFWACFFHLFND